MSRITEQVLRRVDSGRFGFNDPCVICGKKVPYTKSVRLSDGTWQKVKVEGDCEHTTTETAAVIMRVKSMTKEQRQEVVARS